MEKEGRKEGGRRLLTVKRIWSPKTNRVVVKNQSLFTSLHFTLSLNNTAFKRWINCYGVLLSSVV